MEKENNKSKIIFITALVCIALCIPIGVLLGRTLLGKNDQNIFYNNQINNELENSKLLGFDLYDMNNDELNELLNIKTSLLDNSNYGKFMLLYTSNLIINELQKEKIVTGKSSYKIKIDDLIRIGSNYFDYSKIYKEVPLENVSIKYGFIDSIECGEIECDIYYDTINQNEKILKVENASFMPYKTSKYLLDNEKVVNIQNYLVKSTLNENSKFTCDYYFKSYNMSSFLNDNFKVKTLQNADDCKAIPENVDKKLIIDEYFELHFFENENGKFKLISIKN